LADLGLLLAYAAWTAEIAKLVTVLVAHHFANEFGDMRAKAGKCRATPTHNAAGSARHSGLVGPPDVECLD